MLIIPGIIASSYPRVSTSYESIATVTVGSGGSSSITFSSIPSTYKHLQVRAIAKATTGNPEMQMQLNSVTSASYTRHRLLGDGASVSATGTTGISNIPMLGNSGLPTATSTFGVFIIDILDYLDTNKYKTIRVLCGQDSNGSGNVDFTSGLFLPNTNAISSISFALSSSTFVQYSSFALYGIKG